PAPLIAIFMPSTPPIDQIAVLSGAAETSATPTADTCHFGIAHPGQTRTTSIPGSQPDERHSLPHRPEVGLRPVDGETQQPREQVSRRGAVSGGVSGEDFGPFFRGERY